MNKPKIYGIKNCDTMKKTFNWMDEHEIDYEFHDYKKHGADCDLLTRAFEMHNWDSVINRRGMTWRKLPDEIKNNIDHSKALQIAQDKPSVIKRPILAKDDKIYLGFSPEQYEEIFGT